MSLRPSSRPRSTTVRGMWRIRVAGVLLSASLAWYLPWLVTHLNGRALWLAVPFVLGSLVSLWILTTQWRTLSVGERWRCAFYILFL